MLTKRYVPSALTTTLEVEVSGRTPATRAPCRFVPRTTRRTGLMECPAHHEGGSTLRTVGLSPASCASAPVDARTSRHKPVRSFMKILLVSDVPARRFMLSVSLDVL